MAANADVATAQVEVEWVSPSQLPPDALNEYTMPDEEYLAQAHMRLDDELKELAGTVADGGEAAVEEATRNYVSSYYAPLTANMGVEVRYINAEIGKGLFATRNFDVGDIVMREEPLCKLQHVYNRQTVLACQHCLALLGPLQAHLSYMTGMPDIPYMRTEDKLEYPLPEGVKCVCGLRFCSDECLETATELYHRKMCPTYLGEKEGMLLTAFYRHCDNTNEVFRMAAEVIARTMCTAERIGKERGEDPTSEAIIKEAWRPYAMLRKDLWENIATSPDPEVSHKEFGEGLRELMTDSLALLKPAMCTPGFESLFELNVLSSIVGMFEMNCLALLVASPVGTLVAHIEAESWEGCKEDAEDLKQVLDILGDDPEFDCEGTGIFAVQSTMNHSCVPNTEAMKKEGDKTCECIMLAKRPIKAGDELFCSYIDESESYRRRELGLVEYRFKCMCEKCEEQRANPQEESEEYEYEYEDEGEDEGEDSGAEDADAN